MKNLTLIIPAKDEALSLPIFLNELEKYDCNILVIAPKNDHDTLSSIRESDKVKIFFQDNYCLCSPY